MPSALYGYSLVIVFLISVCLGAGSPVGVAVFVLLGDIEGLGVAVSAGRCEVGVSLVAIVPPIEVVVSICFVGAIAGVLAIFCGHRVHAYATPAKPTSPIVTKMIFVCFFMAVLKLYNIFREDGIFIL